MAVKCRERYNFAKDYSMLYQPPTGLPENLLELLVIFLQA